MARVRRGAFRRHRAHRRGLFGFLAVTAAGAIAGTFLVGQAPQARAGLAAVAAPERAAPDAGIAFPLHTSGASIVDARGAHVKLDLVNWYGTESTDYVVGGLKYQPVATIIGEIAAMGFNGVRLPFPSKCPAPPPRRERYSTSGPQPAERTSSGPSSAHECRWAVLIIRGWPGSDLHV